MCAAVPGASSCVPLTVGGEVIGSVLLSRPAPYAEAEEQRIRESVGQAAPVLANLRNLAVAEIRAATDGLTGLPNQRAVTDALKRTFAQASTTKAPLALLLIDLDHFKQINDQRGHPVGDQVLASVGATLRSVLRTRDFAGRNGGEEFAVLLPDTEIDAALEIAERVRVGDRRDLPAGHRRVGHRLDRRGRLPPTTRAPSTGSSGSPTRPCTWPSGRAGTASSWPSRRRRRSGRRYRGRRRCSRRYRGRRRSGRPEPPGHGPTAPGSPPRPATPARYPPYPRLRMAHRSGKVGLPSVVRR